MQQILNRAFMLKVLSANVGCGVRVSRKDHKEIAKEAVSVETPICIVIRETVTILSFLLQLYSRLDTFNYFKTYSNIIKIIFFDNNHHFLFRTLHNASRNSDFFIALLSKVRSNIDNYCFIVWADKVKEYNAHQQPTSNQKSGLCSIWG